MRILPQFCSSELSTPFFQISFPTTLSYVLESLIVFSFPSVLVCSEVCRLRDFCYVCFCMLCVIVVELCCNWLSFCCYRLLRSGLHVRSVTLYPHPLFIPIQRFLRVCVVLVCLCVAFRLFLAHHTHSSMRRSCRAFVHVP